MCVCVEYINVLVGRNRDRNIMEGGILDAVIRLGNMDGPNIPPVEEKHRQSKA